MLATFLRGRFLCRPPRAPPPPHPTPVHQTTQSTAVLDIGTINTPASKLSADICAFWAQTPLPDTLIWG
jgi:hypothetical protein